MLAISQSKLLLLKKMLQQPSLNNDQNILYGPLYQKRHRSVTFFNYQVYMPLLEQL
jgi:hypothetical protein